MLRLLRGLARAACAYVSVISVAKYSVPLVSSVANCVVLFVFFVAKGFVCFVG